MKLFHKIPLFFERWLPLERKKNAGLKRQKKTIANISQKLDIWDAKWLKYLTMPVNNEKLSK